MKIDQTELTKKIDDILYDGVKSMKIAEKVLEAIHEVDADLIQFKNYIFICPRCNKNSAIEEVRYNTTTISQVSRINIDGDGEVTCEYGHIYDAYDAGDEEMEAHYQCGTCEYHLEVQDLKQIVANMTAGEDIS